MSAYKTIFAILLICALSLCAFDGFDVSSAHYRLFVEEIPVVKAPAEKTSVTVTVFNKTDKTAKATVTIHKLVDDWKVVGQPSQTADLPPNSQKGLTFEIVSGPFVFDAHYPVHAHAVFTSEGTQPETLDAVRVFLVQENKLGVNLPKQPDIPVIAVNDDSSLCLADHVADASIEWQYFGQSTNYRAIGWKGHIVESGANVNSDYQTRPDADGKSTTHRAIFMHPPWRPAEGTAAVTFRLKLPNSNSIHFLFSRSQRTEKSNEPRSDGVTYTIQAAETGQPLKTLYNRHENIRVWKDEDIALTAFAGKTIDLRLEVHPGPAKNSACDAAYWGRVLIQAGEQPPVIDYAAKPPAIQQINNDINGNPPFGVLDQWHPHGNALHHGFEISLDNSPLFKPGSAFRLIDCKRQIQPHGFSDTYTLQSAEKTAKLFIYKSFPRKNAIGFQFHAENAFITEVKTGPWHDNPKRIYFGHGYCIENPGNRKLIFNGHTVAASHAAFEFSNGSTVLQAIDNPPNHLETNKDRHTASLVSRGNCIFTFVTAPTAFEAAFQYREYNKIRKPAGAFHNLAGRFIYDIWHGTKGASALIAGLTQATRYGMTDSMLTIHDWQRWGYDYRLPDIWPPRPSWGTVEQTKQIEAICKQYNIPWGFHDNYIDIYPDTDDFSYRLVYFRNNTGDYDVPFPVFDKHNPQPNRAWYTRGRDAQSYKFRPDSILPFVKRNYERILQDVHPTASFVDVLSSVKPTDWYDSDGNYHSMAETRKYWGEAFATIRNMLGGNAPTTSEGGHDQLIGWLDGADCQWLTISDEPNSFYTRFPCSDWARVPWFDAVNHDKFALLGAGYSNRYQGNRPRLTHGIGSDDYLASELLAAHNLMGDSNPFNYDNVRKYWLAQDFIRSTAARNMTAHEFVGGDIHHQHVQWDNGADVWINRSEKPWAISGRILPAYGFHVNYPQGELTLETVNGVVREYARCDSHEFFNARNTRQRIFPCVLDIRPYISDFQYLGGNKIKYVISWEANEAAPYDLRSYVHFLTPESHALIAFQDDHDTPVPTTKFNGVIRDERVVEIPEDRLKFDSYQWTCGLFTFELGRMLLRGYTCNDSSVDLGTLRLKRDQDGHITDATFAKATKGVYFEKEINANPAGTLVDFGHLKTSGAFRLVKKDGALQITPVPQQNPFKIILDIAHYLPNSAQAVVTAEPFEAGGTPVFTATQDGRMLTITITPTTIFTINIVQDKD
ncbi:MAG: hypothetical protein IKX48_11555 [Victivallales bacterium]|nr:hypothetical protein [Victivallales bacterium]